MQKNLIPKEPDQRDGEMAEEYITALYIYELIELCEYGDLHEEILRDRLVIGIYMYKRL